MNKIIIANLKMNMDYNKTIDYVSNINKEIIVCPSYVFIPYFLNKCIVGAQDCYFKDSGSYTGFISPMQLSQMGVKYVLLGHSERRGFESNELINQKVIQAIKNNLNVILCVGENVNEDKFSKIKNELLDNLKDVDIEKVIIAYEPIWAVGTDIIPTNEEISETSRFIKSIIKENYNRNIKVLYGGSIDIDNIKSLNDIESIDGFLIGRAALDYQKINEMYKITNE